MNGHVPATTTRIRPSRADYFRAALFLGVVGFGGGLSVLANIRSLVVTKRRWLTEREFANTVTVAQMLPGGAAANALAYIGLRFGGLAGAALGYVGFVLPGFVAVMVLAALYTHFGTTPQLDVVLGGFNAAVVGIIGAITLKMAKSAVSRVWQMALAAGALLFSTAGDAPPGEVALLAIAAGLMVDLTLKRARLASVRKHRKPEPVVLPEEGATLQVEDHGAHERPRGERRAPAPPPGEVQTALWTVAFVLAASIHATGVDREMLGLALTFFRTGLGAYGGGFAIVPHLKQVVDQTGLVTDRQFADAVAIGKLTPGPVLLLATFIGYVRHGWFGGIVATLSIFSAPFVLVTFAGAWLDRVRSRRPVRAALRGLTPAVLGLLAAAMIALGGTLHGEGEIGIAVATALALSRFELNPVLMLAIGGGARFLLHVVGL
jgi:chromate transporter